MKKKLKWLIPLIAVVCVAAICVGTYMTCIRPWMTVTGLEDMDINTHPLLRSWVCYSLNENTGTLAIFGDGYVRALTTNTTNDPLFKWTETAKQLFDERNRQEDVQRLVITEGIEVLEGALLPKCENATEVYIPASVTLLYDYVFAYSNVKTIYFSGDAPEVDVSYSSTENMDLMSAFWDYSHDLSEVTIVHRPGAEGFDGEEWAVFNVVEEDFEFPDTPPRLVREYLLWETVYNWEDYVPEDLKHLIE